MADSGLRRRRWFGGALAVLGVVCVATAAAARPSDRQTDCLALNIYHEARGESVYGQLAVAQVTLNRVTDPRWPDTVCAVVWQHRQFSWTHDEYSDVPSDATAWALAVSLARLVQRMPLRHFHATHYHADYVSPWWATTLTPVATIGSHHFYQ